MRVFLIQTAKGLFSSSGGYKANNALLRYLAARGHRVRQLCYFHGGEIESYLQTLCSSNGHDSGLHTKMLHMRSEDGRLAVDVQVHELCMDDGVEVVALDSEAFEHAFGGKMVFHSQLARMSAEYIEVIHHISCLSLTSWLLNFGYTVGNITAATTRLRLVSAGRDSTLLSHTHDIQRWPIYAG